MRGLGPPPDLPKEVWDEIFPPEKRKPRPPVRTLYDNLPDGLSEANDPVAPLKVPDPVVLVKERPADETVPAFTRLWRVGLGDILAMEWVIHRLVERSPRIDPQTWQSTLISYMNSSSYFFQRSERAVALATMACGVFDPFYIEPLFILHQDRGPEGGSVKGSQGERDCVLLLRAMRDWGKRQGAQEMRNLTGFSDLPPSVFIQDLKAERREEIRLVMR